MRLLKPEPGFDSPSTVAVGPSVRMKAVYEFLHAIEGSDSTVLITGESGTGKEVIAGRIHERSRRRHRPFVAVSCALFSETLIESELFGHERGAFTGAIGDRPGRFERADGGTVFLDDIDDVPISMQVKLLRVLQNHTIERVGGARTIPINVRILAASKKDLREMVVSGTFREDLYYRLNVVPLALPPLRSRADDIPVLMDHFLTRFFRQRGEEVPPVSEGVRRAFQLYTWPGNVRELENACERIAQTLICDGVRTGCVAANVLFGAADRLCPPVTVSDTPSLPAPRPIDSGPSEPPQSALPPASGPAPRAASEPITGASFGAGGLSLAGSASSRVGGLSLDDQLLQFEANLIRAALHASAGNKTRAAELLKIGRSTLGDRIKRCQIAWPQVIGPTIEPGVPVAHHVEAHEQAPADGASGEDGCPEVGDLREEEWLVT